VGADNGLALGLWAVGQRGVGGQLCGLNIPSPRKRSTLDTFSCC
jgi:hypothetical protein